MFETITVQSKFYITQPITTRHMSATIKSLDHDVRNHIDLIQHGNLTVDQIMTLVSQVVKKRTKLLELKEEIKWPRRKRRNAEQIIPFEYRMKSSLTAKKFHSSHF